MKSMSQDVGLVKQVGVTTVEMEDQLWSVFLVILTEGFCQTLCYIC